MELNEPYLFGNEINYLKECIDKNQLTFGSYIDKFESIVKKYLGSVIPITDHYFATLNSAVFTDGSWIALVRYGIK